jgi:hypothetical protein
MGVYTYVRVTNLGGIELSSMSLIMKTVHSPSILLYKGSSWLSMRWTQIGELRPRLMKQENNGTGSAARWLTG